MAVTYSTSATIELCSPTDPYRLVDTNRLINLKTMLPTYLKETEVEEITGFFQDFLNTLYDDRIYSTSATPYAIENRTKIGLLEKIHRLSETHDPEYVDIEFIQMLASTLGYDVDLNSAELGVLQGQDPNDVCVQEDMNRYLRFVVQNLPNWYKLKTTRDSIRIVLYSFGLVGDLITLWTKNYSTNDEDWLFFKDGIDDISTIPSDYFPTPHFAITIKINESSIINEETRKSLIKAINSIRPVNTVFDSILGYAKEDLTMYTSLSFVSKYYSQHHL